MNSTMIKRLVHMRQRGNYSIHFMSVCLPFSGSMKCLYNTLNTTISFMLNIKDFQLMNSSEKASFKC